MAIYRGMDIGTAKPSRELRDLVPHHLIDIVDPADEFSVAQYVEVAAGRRRTIRAAAASRCSSAARRCISRACSAACSTARRPIGNFGMKSKKSLQHVGQQALYDRLAQVDPVAASHIHPRDTRRLIRALEVYRATGEPISHQQLQFEEGRPAEECRVFVLRRRREELHQRIEGRVEAMVNGGLVEEVQSLTSNGRELGRTARQAVGYREALAYLAGEYDRDEMIARITYRTRRFAKRQGTWFRSLSECRFVDIAGTWTP